MNSDAIKVATTIPVSREMLDDFGPLWSSMNDLMARHADYMINPWNAPHRNPFPTFEPFPRVERARLRLVELRERVSDAFDVLRHGLPDGEDW